MIIGELGSGLPYTTSNGTLENCSHQFDVCVYVWVNVCACVCVLAYNSNVDSSFKDFFKTDEMKQVDFDVVEKPSQNLISRDFISSWPTKI